MQLTRSWAPGEGTCSMAFKAYGKTICTLQATGWKEKQTD